MNATRVERRTSVLSDDDIAKLLLAIDKSEARRLESIGYDLSSPGSRAEIHADHAFVRGLRKGTGRAKMAAVGAITIAILTLLGGWMVSGIVAAIQSVAPAKLP